MYDYTRARASSPACHRWQEVRRLGFFPLPTTLPVGQTNGGASSLALMPLRTAYLDPLLPGSALLWYSAANVLFRCPTSSQPPLSWFGLEGLACKCRLLTLKGG